MLTSNIVWIWRYILLVVKTMVIMVSPYELIVIEPSWVVNSFYFNGISPIIINAYKKWQFLKTNWKRLVCDSSWETGHGSNTALVALISGHLDVSLLTPGHIPWVLHQPVVFAAKSAITRQQWLRGRDFLFDYRMRCRHKRQSCRTGRWKTRHRWLLRWGRR